MKNHLVWIAVPLALSAVPLGAAPAPFYEGISFNATNTSGLVPYTLPSGKTMAEFSSGTGGLFLYSLLKETTRTTMDGGITLYGNPVSVVLGTDENATGWDQGSFNVWKSGKWGSGNSSDKPIFQIDSLAGTTAFDSTNITVTNGSLKVGGSPVLTEGGAPAFVQGLGYLHTSNFASTLAASTPPASAAWSGAYVTRDRKSVV